MLGKLDVQVRVADVATTITIQTQNAQTREMIESASVRLRDLLQENGYQNVNVDVSQRQDQQQARAQSGAREQFDQQEDAASDQETVDPQQRPSSYFSGDGILDTFA
jgi:flagellar hook-length control protein FliK